MEVVLGLKSKMWLALKFAKCVKLLTQPHCHQTDFCVPREAKTEERTTSIELGLEARRGEGSFRMYGEEGKERQRREIG